MSPYNLVLAALATFRLAYLLTKENGPFDIFFIIHEWTRKRAEQRVIEIAESENDSDVDHFWASLYLFVTCPYCMGVYIAFFNLVLMSYFSSVATNVYIYGFAIAGLQTLLQSWKDKQ